MPPGWLNFWFAPICVAMTLMGSFRVNGHRAFGQVTGRFAAELAVKKATRMGTAAISAFECNHVGRLADYVELMADQGLVGFAFANDCGANQVMAPLGGLEGRLSTNPLAIAVPAKPFPLSLDIATSVVAMGKVAVKRNRGEPIPLGWLQDAEGNPTTDPNGLKASPPSTLLPMAGHKGYALAVIIEILSGILTGAGYCKKEPGPDLQGLFLLAVRVENFLDSEVFLLQVRHLTDYLKTSRLRPGCSEVLVPGELEWRMEEQRAREGIPVDLLTWEQIEWVKRELGLLDPLL